MLASELLAMSQGSVCTGEDRCHWCGASCFRQWHHDDRPPTPFSKSRSPARCPGYHYICSGCWLWQRKRVTIQYLGGGFEDGQCPMRKSWYFTPDVALAIGPGSFRELYRILLNPPLRFVLTFVDEREANHLQCCLVNDNAVIRKDTGLKFTINNVPFAYTIYELQEAIRHGPEGKAAGVQELLKMHHPGESFLEDGEVSVKRGRGRPPKVDEEDSRVLHKVVRRSGYETHTTRA